MPDEQDTNDMAWLFPQKGPGKFKDINKKKKKSKGGKKGKAKKPATKK